MDEDEDQYAVREAKLEPEQIAMFLINGAYRDAGRDMTFIEDALYAIRIRQAVREGITNPNSIAIRALELEGWQPQYVVRGEIGLISIAEPEPPKSLN